MYYARVRIWYRTQKGLETSIDEVKQAYTTYNILVYIHNRVHRITRVCDYRPGDAICVFKCVVVFLCIILLFVDICNKWPATCVQTSEYLKAPEPICLLYIIFLFFQLMQSHPHAAPPLSVLSVLGIVAVSDIFARRHTFGVSPGCRPSIVVLVAIKWFVLPLNNVGFMTKNKQNKTYPFKRIANTSLLNIWLNSSNSLFFQELMILFVFGFKRITTYWTYWL